MLSPSSSRRQSRRGGDWTYATVPDDTDQVLWYCPPGGGDRYGNRVKLQNYFSRKGKPYPRELFTFRAGDVPQSWIQVDPAGANGEEEQENGGGAGDAGAGAGGSERTCSSPPSVGKVRSVAVANRFAENKQRCCCGLKNGC